MVMGIGDKIWNGNGKEWEKPYGNPMGMGIGYKIGNGNGKELESIAREWEGVGM